jgi:hypothetical protein
MFIRMLILTIIRLILLMNRLKKAFFILPRPLITLRKCSYQT